MNGAATVPPGLPAVCATSCGVPAARGRRFLTVVVPIAPWVFGSAAIAFAYLPGLVKNQLGGSALVFGDGVTALTALSGILVQPLARRADHPRRPRLLGLAMAIVMAGLLVAAEGCPRRQNARRTARWTPVGARRRWPLFFLDRGCGDWNVSARRYYSYIDSNG